MSLEFTGKDLTEAILQAATTLELPSENVKFTVISMGSPGFLGFGKRLAKISVNPDDPSLNIVPESDQKPAQGTKKADQKNSLSTSKGDRASNNSSQNQTPKSALKADLSDNKLPDAKHSRQAGFSNQRSSQAASSAPASREPQRFQTQTSAGAPFKNDPSPLDWSDVPPPPTRLQKGESKMEDPTDQSALWTLEILGEILQKMGFTAEMKAVRLGPRLVVTLESGERNALLIGARGVTLEALQLLVAKMVYRRLVAADLTIDPEQRIIIDVADYRFRRWTHILETLTTVVERARSTRRFQPFGGLSPAEKRLVQLALTPYRDLTTHPGNGRDSLVISTVDSQRNRRPHGGGR